MGCHLPGVRVEEWWIVFVMGSPDGGADGLAARGNVRTLPEPPSCTANTYDPLRIRYMCIRDKRQMVFNFLSFEPSAAWSSFA